MSYKIRWRRSSACSLSGITCNCTVFAFLTSLLLTRPLLVNNYTCCLLMYAAPVKNERSLVAFPLRVAVCVNRIKNINKWSVCTGKLFFLNILLFLVEVKQKGPEFQCRYKYLHLKLPSYILFHSSHNNVCHKYHIVIHILYLDWIYLIKIQNKSLKKKGRGLFCSSKVALITSILLVYFYIFTIVYN